MLLWQQHSVCLRNPRSYVIVRADAKNKTPFLCVGGLVRLLAWLAGLVQKCEALAASCAVRLQPCAFLNQTNLNQGEDMNG